MSISPLGSIQAHSRPPTPVDNPGRPDIEIDLRSINPQQAAAGSNRPGHPRARGATAIAFTGAGERRRLDWFSMHAPTNSGPTGQERRPPSTEPGAHRASGGRAVGGGRACRMSHSPGRAASSAFCHRSEYHDRSLLVPRDLTLTQRDTPTHTTNYHRTQDTDSKRWPAARPAATDSARARRCRAPRSAAAWAARAGPRAAGCVVVADERDGDVVPD